MDGLLETLYAKEMGQKDPNCKTCKNKPDLQKNGLFWIAVWMMIMSLYGNIILFKQIFGLIF